MTPLREIARSQVGEAVEKPELSGHRRRKLGRLVIATAAIHAVPCHDIRTILTTDLNLARGTLEIRRGPLRHTLWSARDPRSIPVTRPSASACSAWPFRLG
ncbi:hypothetical protein ACFXBB_02000 [Streptomyces scopuliridis]|uniref:hypothetical protein n=1 Tax=Streptomyces scopuliridis TaxID=452529 RepID=UPI0036C3C3F9